jgi:flagellin FlaB
MPHVRRLLERSGADQRGVTGLETAIILIAFIVVASVFAYSVLSAGVFSSEERQTGHPQGPGAGPGDHAGRWRGRPPGHRHPGQQYLGRGQGRPGALHRIHRAGGHSLDLATTVDSDNDGELSDESSQTHTTVISYIDVNQRMDDIAWIRTEVGKGDGDTELESGEKMRIEVNTSQLSTLLGEEGAFTIEVKSYQGGTVVIRRTTPAVIDAVMYLN